MERQHLVFLDGGDEADLLARADAVLPGLVVLPGRYVRDPGAAGLLEDPGRFAFTQGLRSQRRIYLAHRGLPSALVLDEMPDTSHGIDPERSEVMELWTPVPYHRRLAPARLSAALFSGGEKKSAAFVTWVNRVMRALEAAYPPTSLDFVHLAPGAFVFAAGGGQLTYLEEPVLPAPGPGRGPPPRARLPP